MTLNALGRFVVLLDGFDEMKHMLTWEEFRFNFRQLNRLVSRNSKVLLFGRPTAFLNATEHQYALHGIRTLGDQYIREPDWPDYKEVQMLTFGPEQVYEFLSKYLSYRRKVAESPKDRLALDVLTETNVSRIADKQFADIARRPVQLQMLAEILPGWKGDLDNLTIAVLYSHFIDLVIERERDKLTRHSFSVKQRREFAKQLALWLWRRKKDMPLSASDIPDEILSGFTGALDDPEAVRRDLVSACFLEKKADEALYFPHRSFQEFLVAEAIVEQLGTGAMTIGEADRHLTDEVSLFMESMVSDATLRKWEKQLEQFRGSISWRFAKVWSSLSHSAYLLDRFQAAGSSTPWYAFLLTVAGINQRLSPLVADKLQEELLNALPRGMPPEHDIVEGKDNRYYLLCCLCITCLGAPSAIEAAMVSLKYVGVIETKRDMDRSGHERKTYVFRQNPWAVELLKAIQVTSKQDILELGGIYPVFYRALKDYCLLADWVLGDTIRPPEVPRKIRASAETVSAIHQL